MKNSLLHTAACLALAGLFFCFSEHARAAAVPPPPGMVLWLPLDEAAGPIAANLVPGTSAGAWTGTPAVVPDYVARGLCFNGTGADYVEVPNYPALEIGTNDFTLDCWMRFDGLSMAGDYIILNKYSGLNAGQQWGYGLALSNGRLHCRFADGSIGAYSDTAFLFTPNPSTWYHVAVTVRRGAANGGQFYVNGTPMSSFNPAAHPGSLANGQPFRVAKAINAQTPAPWPGCADEVEVFNRALSAAEVAALFAAGRAGKVKPNCTPLTGFSYCLNSGVSAGGAALPAGSVDPLFQAASPNFPNYPNAYVQGLPPYPLWNTTPGASQWITPDANALNFIPFTTYTFRSTVVVPNPAGTHLVGRWLAGAVGRILVNGVHQAGGDTPGSPGFGATTWTPVNISAGFVAGLNTIDFEVDAWSVTPCGMRAELCVTSPPPANCVSIQCPADQDVVTCGTNAPAAYIVTAASNCGGNAGLLCHPPTGMLLPPGTNVVQCVAFDGLGACANCAFKIVVRRDTNAPVVLCPGDITDYVCGGGVSGPVNFLVTVTDDSGAIPPATCTNQFGQAVTSGQSLPVGTTTVTCFATDNCGRAGQCSFQVTILANQQLPFAFGAGVRNGGAGWSLFGNVIEPATPGACLNAAYPVPVSPWVNFDHQPGDGWFGQDFPWLPPGLVSARLDAVMRPYPLDLFGLGATADHDVINLHHLTCAPGGGFAWGQEIQQLPGSGGTWSRDPNWHVISLDLANLPPGFPGNTNNLLPLLNSPGHNRLEVLVQDDTTVDYLRLSGTFCPAGSFLDGVPMVPGPNVTPVHVPGAALRLDAPSMNATTLATFPLGGGDGLALSVAGWGTDDLNNDGATDPVDAFSKVEARPVCAQGVCNGLAVTWTPDGRVAVWVDPLQDRYSNATVRVEYRDDAGNEAGPALMASNFPAVFTFRTLARPTTNVTCPDMWGRPGLIVFNPDHAAGSDDVPLLSLAAGCGRMFTNENNGTVCTKFDIAANGVVKVAGIKPVESVVLSSHDTTGATLGEVTPVIVNWENTRARTGRRQHISCLMRTRFDPLPLLLPHPNGWNATGLGSNSTLQLRLDTFTPSLELTARNYQPFFDVFVEPPEFGATPQVITSHFRGQVAGVPDQVIDSCVARLVTNSVAGGGGVRLEPDFSALGATSFRVQLYDSQMVVWKDQAGNTTDAGIAGTWPDRWGNLGGTTRCRSFSWTIPTRYTLGTQTFTNIAFALVLAEEGPGAPVIDGLSGLDFTTTGTPMLDLGRLKTDLGAQRVLRIAPAGTGLRLTWSPPGGRLEESTNLVNWTTATNLSGDSLLAPAGRRFYRVRD